ncbi:hypothetical protein Q5424_19275 [Conexibacter sp. JD483]|uniref:hypothetical protein n=1 Tax=unclassified Conexibacter TaxID=2627773 RepID=UPI0027166CAF|nr:MULTISPECIES: hypothetical protein [unclassified Conexibacter]MDO8186814.1 hypothetical protein [Conexibacter sp. CPCC 205706]MDO8197432.1 hypothetical protein [Conexibacter sp. CPCC 205762]MDR9371248.1 hypothetical protein [Conexibacter sp. JD483]
MSEEASLGALAGFIGVEVLRAAALCAVPHWVDDQLAVELLELDGHNGRSHALVECVKQLPFVRLTEGHNWRVEEAARAVLLAPLRETDVFARSSELLGRRFAHESDAASDWASRGARISQWRAAYHLIPVDSDDAARRAAGLATAAAHVQRFADLDAAIELLRQPVMAAYATELAYAEGRYAYARGDEATARRCFMRVWDAKGTDQMTAISGHLLGVMSGGIPSEQILKEAAAIARDVRDDFGYAQILTTLVNGMLERKGASMVEAEKLARELVEAPATMDLPQRASVFTTLGQVQIKSGHLAAADDSFRRAVEFARASGEQRRISVALLSWSWLKRRMGDEHAALDLIDAALRSNIAEGEVAIKNVKLTSARLERLLDSIGQTPERWEILERSSASLVYAREGKFIVVVNRAVRQQSYVPVPASLRGVWRDEQSMSLVEIGATLDVNDVAHPRRGVVLVRT